MFNGFSKDAFDFLFGIRMNNSREWFEPRKKIYTKELYEPLKELNKIICEPFEKYGMISKTGRIYRDEHFPPYLHYRDRLWIDIRYQSYYWSRTPALFFEISPEGVEFGFCIPAPLAAVMEKFRTHITENTAEFLGYAESLRKFGIEFGGDEYKRPKKCTVPEAEEFFLKKGLSATKKISDISKLAVPEIADEIIDVFRLVMPLNELFHEFVNLTECEKAMQKIDAMTAETPAAENIKAPDVEFMW